MFATYCGIKRPDPRFDGPGSPATPRFAALRGQPGAPGALRPILAAACACIFAAAAVLLPCSASAQQDNPYPYSSTGADPGPALGRPLVPTPPGGPVGQSPGAAGGFVPGGAEPAFATPALGPDGQPLPPVQETTIAPVASTQISRVVVEGNRQVPMHKIRPHILTRAGRPLDRQIVEEDVRRLNRSRLFASVRVLYRPQTDGTINVVFRVVDRPTVQYVKFVGAIQRWMSRDIANVLTKESGIKAGDIRDPIAIEDGRRRIEDYYRGRGFNRVRVTVFEGTGPDDLGVVYVIHEGPKEKISKVHFVGAQVSSPARLRVLIESKPFLNIPFFPVVVDREKIDADVDRLLAYYRSLGFFRAEIGRELNFNDADNRLELTFFISEGPRYKIRNVVFSGNTLYTEEQLKQNLKLTPGEFFDQRKLELDERTVTDRYGAIGHVFAAPNPEPQFVGDNNELDLVYNIQEGDRWRVGHIKVKVRGDDVHTRHDVVLNRLSFHPGQIIDTREVRASERRLKASQLFLVDPARGAEPKIYLKPLNPDGPEEEFAEGEPENPTVRGQSPDSGRRDSGRPDSRRTGKVPAAWSAATGGLRELEVVVEGELLPPPATETDATPRTETDAAPRTTPGAGTPPTTADPVIRGQDPGSYNPFGGARSTGLSTSKPRRSAPRGNRGNSLPPIVQAGTSGGYRAGTPSTRGQSPARGPIVPTPAANAYPQTPYPGPGAEAPVTGGPGGPNSGGYLSEFTADPEQVLEPEVIVDETTTGRFMIGGGYNSSAGLVGSIIADEQNFNLTRVPRSWEDVRNGRLFRGKGQRLRLEAAPGTQVQRYSFTFQEPYAFNSNVSFGLSGHYYNRLYREWDEKRIGGNVRLGYQLAPDLYINGGVGAESITIYNPIFPTPPKISRTLGENEAYSGLTELVYDIRDNAFLPTEGHRIALGYEYVFGSFDYSRVTLGSEKHFVVAERVDGSGRHTFSLSGKVGYSTSDTPMYDAFTLGGYATVRGFNFRGASPRQLGAIVGGNFQMYGTAQYMFPLTANDMFRGVVFCDVGTVEEDLRFSSDTFRVTVGAGVRINVAALGPAPIAVDIGIPIHHAPFDDIQNVSVFVGINR